MQLYAFPSRSKRAAAAAAARQVKQEQQGQDQGEGTAETARAKTEARASAGAAGAAAPMVSADAVMEDAAATGVAVKEEVGSSPGEGLLEPGAGGGSAEEGGLPVLLLRELASFRARFPQRVGKHLRADAAEVVLKEEVRVRAFRLFSWLEKEGFVFAAAAGSSGGGGAAAAAAALKLACLILLFGDCFCCVRQAKLRTIHV